MTEDEYNNSDLETQVAATKTKAEATEGYDNRCFICKDKVFFVPADKAYTQGHIYSDAGAKEYQISKSCEYCFDNLFKDDEND